MICSITYRIQYTSAVCIEYVGVLKNDGGCLRDLRKKIIQRVKISAVVIRKRELPGKIFVGSIPTGHLLSIQCDRHIILLHTEG